MKAKIRSIAVLLGILLISTNLLMAQNPDDNLEILEDGMCNGKVKLKTIRYDGGNKISDYLWVQFKATDGSWKTIFYTNHYMNDGHNTYSPEFYDGGEYILSYSDGPYYWEYYFNPEAVDAAVYNTEVTIRAVESSDATLDADDPTYELTCNPWKANAPTAVQASQADYCGYVSVSWEAPSNISGKNGAYRVYRDGSPVNSNATSPYKDYTSGSHEYKVAWVSECDNFEGTQSSTVTGSTKGAGSAPSGLTATDDQCENKIELRWEWYDGNPSEFTLKRSTSPDLSGATSFTINGDLRNYTDAVPNANQTYYYKVGGKDECNNELYSSVVEGIGRNAPVAPSMNNAYVSGPDIIINWTDNSSTETGFEIVRTSPQGSSSFTVDEDVTSYTDNGVGSCVTYTYKVKAKNTCAVDGVISANSKSAKRSPSIGSAMSTFETSKGYFNDKVKLDWDYTNQNDIEKINVYRREYGSGSYKLIESLDPTTTYADVSATAGVLYQYKIQGQKNCENTLLTTNYREDIGLRSPTAIVSGHIEFENGQAVKDVAVLVANSSGANGTSLYFNGSNAYASIPSSSTLSPTTGISIEAWVKPTSNKTNNYILSKGTAYELYLQNKQPVFKLNNGAATVHFTVDTFETNEWRHIAVSYDKAYLRLYVNGRLKDSVAYASNIYTNSNSLYIGRGSSGYFSGNIDEVRVWNRAKSSKEIYRDYQRIASGDENGLVGAWNLDENTGSYIFDRSHVGVNYNKNHGNIYSTSWSSDINTQENLSYRGYTDENGDYTVSGIRYSASGENFLVVPYILYHTFQPSNKTLFLGSGNDIVNNVDFTDKSSFRVTGTVQYDDCSCYAEDVRVLIDGESIIKDGLPIQTDENGFFDLNVPIGYHKLSVVKNGHVFKNEGKWPPASEEYPDGLFYYKEPITGIEIIDSTKVKVVGRVVGGSVEAAKDPALGLSVNNIGVAHLQFDAEGVGVPCYTNDVYTDVNTGEYTIDLPPMRFVVHAAEGTNPNAPVLSNPGIIFDAFPILDLNNNFPIQTVSVDETIDVNAYVRINSQIDTARVIIEGDTTFQKVNIVNNSASVLIQQDIYAIAVTPNTTYTYKTIKLSDYEITRTNTYQVENNYIYRTEPQIVVTANDGSPFMGEKKISYKLKDGTKFKIDIEKSPFKFPVFEFTKSYKALIAAVENYKNLDVDAPVDMDTVPVSDGKLIIINGLANDEYVEQDLTETGSFLYDFKAGKPNILYNSTHPEYSFTQIFNLNLQAGGKTYEWTPLSEGDGYYRAYILGNRPINGTDFITEGPQLVEYILRDPPGSESYAFHEAGSTHRTTTTFNLSSSQYIGVDTEIKAGVEFETGLGYSTETSIEATETESMEVSLSEEYSNTLEKTTTYNETWQTSDSPELAGAASDLYIGSSTNYAVGLTNNIQLIPDSAMGSSTVVTTGEINKGFTIGLKKSFIIAPTGESTDFIYSQDHILNYLIPQLIQIRNDILLSDANYESYLSADNQMFGSNNDDPEWGTLATSENYLLTDPEDWDGPSYHYLPADLPENQRPKDFKDKVRYYNQQIRLWQEAIEENEREKMNATLKKNISFDAGSEYSYTVETTRERINAFTVELGISYDWALSAGIEVGGSGLGATLAMGLDVGFGFTGEWASGSTNSNGFVLHDPDQGDYFSVDVKDPHSDNSLVFVLKGGRSMCPSEGGEEALFYKNQKYKVTDTNKEFINKTLKTLTANELNDEFIELKDIAEGMNGSYNFPSNKASKLKSVVANLANLPDSLANAAGKDIENNMLSVTYDNESKLSETVDTLTTWKFISQLNDFINSMDSAKLADDYNTKRTDLLQYNLCDPTVAASYYNVVKRALTMNAGVDTVITETLYLNAATIQREQPTISAYPPEMFDIYEDKKAYFTLDLGNENPNGDAMWYKVRVVDGSNPYGATIEIDGEPIEGREFEIPAGKSIQKMITVKKGDPDVFDYDSIGIMIYSPCDWEFHTNGRTFTIGDTCWISTHFIPACTDISVSYPKDNFLINYDMQDEEHKYLVNVTMDQFDYNSDNLQKIQLQYKPAKDNEWRGLQTWWKKEGDIPSGTNDLLMPGATINYLWDVTQLPDANFEIRALTTCAQSTNANEPNLGIFDRKPPVNFGAPQPADGILSPGDEVMIQFNEAVFDGNLHYDNFDISGILNQTELDHGASVYFEGSDQKFMIISDPFNLIKKSFSIELWAKRIGDDEQCLLSQGNDAAEGLWIGFDNKGLFTFQVNGESIKTEKDELQADPEPSWHHWVVSYNYENGIVQLYKDGDMIKDQTIHVDYEGLGRILVGKSSFGKAAPFYGQMHELRLWNMVIPQIQVVENMNMLLSSKEKGLTAVWRMNEGMKTIIKETMLNRNATLTSEDMWKVEPAGEAIKFDGVNDYLDMLSGDIAFYYERDFSIEFWFKSMQGANVCFLSNGKGDATDDNPVGWTINTDSEGAIWIRNNGISFKAADAGTFDGKWHHFALVMNRIGNLTSYVDGEQQYNTSASKWGEFGGAKMFIGARATVDGALITADQFFNGEMDEVRIWGMQRKQEILKQYINSRLRGDEAGLVAYFPFESYQDYAGVLMLNQSWRDAITDTDWQHDLLPVNGADFAGESPNIKLTRPEKKVNFFWTTNNDKIILTITDPASLIENTQLNFTATKVEDMHSNLLQSPVTWSAYVKMNQVSWEEKYFKFEKELYQPLSFETKIINEGGTQQEFDITNLPPWLEASPQSGSIDPLSEQIITFTVSEGINTGYYSQDIYLSTGFDFDEKLVLDLRVFKEEPEWEVEPSDYEFNMNMVAQLKIDNILSTDIYDKVAAFVGDECRGVANLQYVKEYDMYEVFMDIYSNSANGENIEFRVWDSDKATLHTDVTPVLTFSSNDIHGTPSSPMILNAQDVIENRLSLKKGWNWVSLNVESESLANLDTLFKDLRLADADLIQYKEYFDEYNPSINQWVGDISSNGGIKVENMYKIKLNDDNELVYKGHVLKTSNTLIEINEGWNWIGYIPRVNMTVGEALASLELKNNDIIKAQDKFAVYDEYMGWLGSLKYLKPGEGYMLKTANAGTLTYKESGTLKSSTNAENYPELEMQVNARDYSSNMTLIAKVVDVNGLSGDDVLYAMAGDECRGYGYAVYDNSQGKYLFYVTLFGDKTENLSFVSINSATGQKIYYNEKVAYSRNKSVGTPDEPMLLTKAENVDVMENYGLSCYPNPFEVSTTIQVNLSDVENQQVEIYNVQGKKVNSFNTDSKIITWDGTNYNGNKVTSGVYFIRCGIEQIKVIKK
jgi:hypothetical protein